MTADLPTWFFAPARPITVARAPGRLDVMGGVADYSGSVVLEAPLAQATTCALQPREDTRVRVRSEGLEQYGFSACWEGDLRSILVGPGESYEHVRHRLTGDPATAWVAYAAGVVTVLHAEAHLKQPPGLDLFLRSDVPLGGGVSSSASVEVAVMMALQAALGLRLDGLELARLCQRVENRVAGAPCGIMDQVTCALAEAGRLIAIRCRPCEVLGHWPLPQTASLFGIHSGVKHSVGGSRYTRARVAAFMGLKLLRETGYTSTLEYLSDLDPAAFRRISPPLPSRISGSEFIALHGETDDSVTRVDPNESYSIRGAVEHAVFENWRVQRFIEHLAEATSRPKALEEAGRMMYGSHWSYGHRIGLGARETDLLVSLARNAGPAAGIYGAKITGGGSGGTVALLAAPGSEATVRAIAEEYRRRSGRTPEILEGTSAGAVASGVQTVIL